MLKQFFQNAKQPRGFWGRSMLSKMNAGHTPLSHWALPQLRLAEDSHVLDIGCGGGANLLRLLKRCPQGQIDGLDYAAESVRYSRKKVGRALGEHCRVTQGDAGQLPYPEQSFDAVTAFETIYFWPDLPKALGEIWRVLKPGGQILLVVAAADPTDHTWTDMIEGMTIYSEAELTELLNQANYTQISPQRHARGWLSLLATRPA